MTSLITRKRRIAGYAFWTAGGAMLPLALDRLVIHPTLNVHFGVEVFGAFLWVLGIVNLVGSAAADGFAMLLMRDFSRQSSVSAGRMFRTAAVLNVGLSLAILLPVLAISGFFAAPTLKLTGLAIYLPLGVLAILRATSLVMVSNMRIRRRFKTIFSLGVVEAVVLVMILFVAPTGSLWLVGAVYVASAALTVLVACSLTHELRLGFRPWQEWLDPVWVRWFLSGWVVAAMLNILNGSQFYLARIVLGAMAEVTDVAILYAGTAMANLFVMPVTILSALVFSLLGGRSDAGLSHRERNIYLTVSILISVVVGGVTWLGGGWLVSRLYPDLAATTLGFFHWIAIGNGLLSLMFLMRPVVLKYGGLRQALQVAAVCFGVQFVGLILLIPAMGAEGAAIGQMLGSGAVAVAWTWMALRTNGDQLESSTG